MRLLSTTAEIQQEVRRLMKPGTRRVVITAFVGAGASVYIPKPKGVVIVCWPKAGGTNPRAVREFLDRDANVRFADRLHMKVFWAAGRGTVVGSANLSTNALGSGQLKELVVCLPPEAVKIDRLLKSIKSRSVTARELKTLDREHRKLGRTFVGRESPAPNYRIWFKSKHRSDWKIGWWTERVDHSIAAKKWAKAEYNRKPRASIVARAHDYRDYDWILSMGLGGKKVKSPEWIFADFRIKWSSSKKENYPFEAVQVSSNQERTAPPFLVSKEFKNALDHACQQFGISKLKSLKTSRPPEAFLRMLYDSMPPVKATK